MHYPVLDADWRKISGIEQATIVVPAQVLKELNHFKDHHAHESMRKRLRRILSKIEQVLDDKGEGMIRQHLPILVKVRQPPKSRLEEFHLDPEESDDLILLDALIAREEGAMVTIVSGDQPLRIYAKQHDLPVAMPPADRFEDPQTQSDRTIAELRRQVEKQPKLMLHFEDGSNHTSFKAHAPFASSLRNDFVTKASFEAADFPRVRMLGGGFFYEGQMISESEAARYRREVSEFHSKQLQYFKSIFDVEERIFHMVKLKVTVTNEGSSPAEDTIIQISAPSGTSLYLENGLPNPIEAPVTPEEPRSIFSGGFLSAPHYDSLLPSFLASRLARENHQRGPSHSYEIVDATTLVGVLGNIVQKRRVVLPTLFLEFTDSEEPKSIKLSAELTSSTVPALVKTDLHVRMEPEYSVSDDEEFIFSLIERYKLQAEDDDEDS